MKIRKGKAGLHHPKKQHKPKMRTLELCIISAQDLKNVRKFGKMRTYAVAYVNPMHKVCTGIDREGGTNPTWDEKLKLEVEEELLLDDSYTQLTIDIFNHGPLREKLVGSVRILLCDAVKENLRSLNRFPVASYLVFRPKGDPQGILNVCIPPGGRFPDSLDCISFKKDGDNNSTRFPCLSKQSSLCMTEVTTESEEVSELTEVESLEDADEGVENSPARAAHSSSK